MLPGRFSADEFASLLGRPANAAIRPDERTALAGRLVLVTGAAGSIGSALARELAACRPAVLGVFDQSELGLFALERELRSGWPDLDLAPILADVTRPAAVRAACASVRPDVVYHAAAYKHVTMAERAAGAAALVNVIGTFEVAAAASKIGARFVLISSDKAADPRSVMGATKRLAERVTLAMASRRFRPIVVRFGNVLGSSGSVLPIMRDCVRRGVPLPITDPDATRYFMTDAEAVALVLRADSFGSSAEIFWLDMGEPVRMGDLAERLLDLEARAGFPRVPILVTGLRPGEKKSESLADAALTFERTVDERIRVARERPSAAAGVLPVVGRLRRAALRADDRAALALLASAVPGFAPSRAATDAADRCPRSGRRPRRTRRAA